MSFDSSLTPALSPRRGRNGFRVCGNTNSRIGRPVGRENENVQDDFLSRGGRKTFFGWTAFVRPVGLLF